MNRLFRLTRLVDRATYQMHTAQYLDPAQSRKSIYEDLEKQEFERQKLFAQELQEKETEDFLDRALIKAQNAKKSGVLSAPEYHKINEKIQALKKLKFVEEYEKHQDPQLYEWIKYKVAAEVGGQKEQEEFAAYEKEKIDELGEVKFRLLKESAPKIL